MFADAVSVRTMFACQLFSSINRSSGEIVLRKISVTFADFFFFVHTFVERWAILLWSRIASFLPRELFDKIIHRPNWTASLTFCGLQQATNKYCSRAARTTQICEPPKKINQLISFEFWARISFCQFSCSFIRRWNWLNHHYYVSFVQYFMVIVQYS